MHHGLFLGRKQKARPQNSPVIHCQHRYSLASSPTFEWRITCFYKIYQETVLRKCPKTTKLQHRLTVYYFTKDQNMQVIKFTIAQISIISRDFYYFYYIYIFSVIAR